MVYFCIYYTPYIRIYAIGNLIILRENETITGLWGFGVSNSRVDTFGTGTIEESKIEEIIDKVFDLRPAAIIDALDLRRPIYKQTAAYGHFGRTDIDLPWEHLDKIDEIRKYV
jgi:S-adenosylmethionine synthetase